MRSLHEMPHSEYVVWQALDALRAEEEKTARKQQSKGMKSTPARGF